jgi:DNA polymerase-3 subunit gamma/tau
VIFILATTEVQKLPQTILSRCQRYDFRRIPIKVVIDQLKKICQGEGIPAEDEALWVVARQGDGSMRDSQSLLDQVITFANGPLTLKNTVEILGLTDRTLLVEAVKALVYRDTKAVMAVLEKIASSGFEPHLFSQDLLESIRNLLVVKVSGAEASRILELPDSELQALSDLGAQVSEEDVHFLFDMALKGGNDIPKAQDPRIVLEIMLLRMAAAPKIVDLESLLRGGARRGLRASATANGSASATGSAARSSAPAAPAAPPAPKFVTGANPQEKWMAFVDQVRQDDAIFAAKIENLLFVKDEANILMLAVPPKLAFLRQQMNDSAVHAKLQGFIDSYWAAGYSFQVLSGKEPVAGESAQSLALKKQQQAEDELRQQIAENPMVKSAQAVFKGQIKAVTEIANKGRR